jgi:hypothetical protein
MDVIMITQGKTMNKPNVNLTFSDDIEHSIDTIEHVVSVLDFLTATTCWPARDQQIEMSSEQLSGLYNILLACQTSLQEAAKELGRNQDGAARR